MKKYEVRLVESDEELKVHPMLKYENAVNKKGKPYQKTNPHIPEKGGIYFLFGEDTELLYIGQSENLRKRISVHNNDYLAELNGGKPPSFCSWIVEEDETKRKVLELLLLDRLKPRLNGRIIEEGMRYVVGDDGKASYEPVKIIRTYKCGRLINKQIYSKVAPKLVKEAYDKAGFE